MTAAPTRTRRRAAAASILTCMAMAPVFVAAACAPTIPEEVGLAERLPELLWIGGFILISMWLLLLVAMALVLDAGAAAADLVKVGIVILFLFFLLGGCLFVA